MANDGFWTDAQAQSLDKLNAMTLQTGTYAALPAAAQKGKMYVVSGDGTPSNNGRVFRDTGAAWVEMIPSSGAGVAATPRLHTMSGATANDMSPAEIF